MLEFADTTISYLFTNYTRQEPFKNLDALVANIIDRKKKSKNGEKDSPNKLYDPVVFHLFGSHDILILNEIASLSFNNKTLLTNSFDLEYSDITTSKSIHSLSGFTFYDSVAYGHATKKTNGANSSNKTLRAIFSTLKSSSYFICFTQYKINTAYLFSGGAVFVNQILSYIKKTYLKNVKHIITFSFSSYELSVSLFSKNIIELNTLLQIIRNLRFNQVFSNPQLLLNDQDLFCDFYEKILGEKDGTKSHQIFSDSQTSFGISLTKGNSEWCFPQKANLELRSLKFDIEWKIKPGHMKIFLQDLSSLLKTNIVTLHDKLQHLPGKTDVQFDKTFTFDEYQLIFKDLRKPISSSELKVSVRKYSLN